MIRKDYSTSQALGARTSQAAQKIESKDKLNSAVRAGVAGAMLGGIASVVTQPPASHAAAMGAVAGAAVGMALAGISSLKLPNDKVYQIKQGDTLWDIAKGQLGEKASVDELKAFVAKLQELNNDVITNQDLIYAGDKIALPSNKEGQAIKAVSLFGDDTGAKIEVKALKDGVTPEQAKKSVENNGLDEVFFKGADGKDYMAYRPAKNPEKD